jgi:hypothetical protein
MATPRAGLIARLGGAAFSLLSCAAGEMERVGVLDAEFRPVSTLTSAGELAAFNAPWAARVEESGRASVAADYKIDIQTGGRSVRWLYDSEGFVQVLSAGQRPVYRLPSPTAFNALLGITVARRPG